MKRMPAHYEDDVEKEVDGKPSSTTLENFESFKGRHILLFESLTVKRRKHP